MKEREREREKEGKEVNLRRAWFFFWFVRERWVFGSLKTCSPMLLPSPNLIHRPAQRTSRPPSSMLLIGCSSETGSHPTDQSLRGKQAAIFCYGIPSDVSRQRGQRGIQGRFR